MPQTCPDIGPSGPLHGITLRVVPSGASPPGPGIRLPRQLFYVRRRVALRDVGQGHSFEYHERTLARNATERSAHSPIMLALVSDLPLTGGCLCGGVRYEISEPLVSASYCHCTRCQRRTGSAAACSARVVPGSLRITQGQELVQCWQPEEGFAKCFCSSCGGALWSRHPDDPDRIGVRMGTFDSDPGVRPSYRQFVAHAASWEQIPDDGLERFRESAA